MLLVRMLVCWGKFGVSKYHRDADDSFVVLREILPTIQTRFDRDLAYSNISSLCQDYIESNYHGLSHCPKAMLKWLSIIPHYRRKFFSLSELRSWVVWNLGKNCQVESVNWSICLTVACRNIWLTQNHFVFFMDMFNHPLLYTLKL